MSPTPSITTNASATSADGARIAYELCGGASAPVVLVHGWCCDRTCWDAQMALLATRWRVVRLDLAGHGQSDPRQHTDWSMAAFGADVSAR